MEYKIYMISNRHHLFSKVEKSLDPESLNLFDGTGYPSFSKLINECVEQCPTEIVIMLSDKARPTSKDVKKMLSLLAEGYGFVGMYSFGFFGFKKQLFRQIGMMDERYVGGGHEDDDFYIRLAEANIAMYISSEIEFHKGKSGWNYDMTLPHFNKKWPDVKKTKVASRKLLEETYRYNLGQPVDTNFLPFSFSQVSASRIKKYTELKFENKEREK